GLIGAINLDTVGRLQKKKLSIMGTGTATEWQHIFRGCGFVTGVECANIAGSYEGSDQRSFIEKGIPAVQIFTQAHEDYHRSTDTIDKLDLPGLVRVATFVKEAVVYLGEREEPLTITISGNARPDRPAGKAEGGRRVQFGSVPDFAHPGPGVLIESVVKDSPAAKAGIEPGDLLVQIDGTEIADLRAFSELLGTLQPGQTVKATVVRKEKRVVIEVTVQAR
ncbi:MAG: PDZ domain-containing protein, partial [Planctomycetota bacterium]